LRGPDEQTSQLFSYLSPEQRVAPDHPLRAVRRITDTALQTLSPRFAKLYADMGRPSIPPEQLLRALVVQVLYSVRSERLLMEAINYSILFRWFVGLSLDDPIWSHSTFSKNRDRLLRGDVAAAFFDAVVTQARAAGLLSDEHFTVDGTQLEAWASPKSFRPRDTRPADPPDEPGNPDGRFSRGTAVECDARVDDRSRCAIGQEGAGRQERPRVSGPRLARQSARAGGERVRDGGHRDR
jgi:transposase